MIDRRTFLKAAAATSLAAIPLPTVAAEPFYGPNPLAFIAAEYIRFRIALAEQEMISWEQAQAPFKMVRPPVP